jgi:heat shock protein HslJ
LEENLIKDLRNKLMKWLTLSCLGVLVALVLNLVSSAQAEFELVGTHWRVVEINGSPVEAAEPKREPHLVFNAEGRVSGSSGCNRIAGAYKQDAGSLSFTPLAMTKMACPPPLDAQERSFLQAIEATTALRQSGNTLELLDAGGKVRIRLQAR